MNPMLYGRPQFAPVTPSPYGMGYGGGYPQTGVFGGGGGGNRNLGSVIAATGALVTWAGIPALDLTAAPTAADFNGLKNATRTGALIQAIGGLADLLGVF